MAASLTRVALAALPAVLCLCIFDGLPLHVGGRVRAAAGKRDDVIDDVAGPAVRMTSGNPEFVLGREGTMSSGVSETRRGE